MFNQKKSTTTLTALSIASFLGLLVSLAHAALIPMSSLPGAGMTVYSGTGVGPDNMAFDGTNMWTGNRGSTVTKISPTGEMTTYSSTGLSPSGIVFDGTNMWTANATGGSVSKIDRNGIITTHSIGKSPTDIAFDGSSLWTSNQDESVTKISLGGVVLSTYTGTGLDPNGIAFDGTNMWTANEGGSSVTKISPAGVMTTYTGTGSNPYAIAFDGTNMWTANGLSDSVSRISPTGSITTFPLPAGTRPIGIAFNGVDMWVTGYGNSSVSKISPAGVVTTYTISRNPFSIAFDENNSIMWVGNSTDNRVTKFSVRPELGASPVTAPATGIVGETMTLSGTVSNTGLADATEPFSNIFQFVETPPGYYAGGNPSLGAPNTTSLDSGASMVSRKSWTPTAVGTYTVRVCADNDTAWNGVIEESDGDNNCSPEPLTSIVVNGPDLIASDVVPTTASSGTRVTLSASVSNVGAVSTTEDDIVSSFKIDGDNNHDDPVGGVDIITQSGSNILGGIPRDGDDATISTQWTPLVAKTYYVNACVDQHYATGTGGVPEADEYNNCTGWTPVVVGPGNAVPTLTTPTANSVDTSSAILGAVVSSLGIPTPLTARGVCYGQSPDPSIGAPGVTCATATLSQALEAFSVSVAGLLQNTPYYYRGYASNSTGTGYSVDGEFTTKTQDLSCRECQKGYGWTGSVCAPFECPAGQEWDGAKCKILSCTSCSAPWAMNKAGVCVPIKCPSGQIWNSIEGVCK